MQSPKADEYSIVAAQFACAKLNDYVYSFLSKYKFCPENPKDETRQTFLEGHCQQKFYIKVFDLNMYNIVIWRYENARNVF